MNRNYIVLVIIAVGLAIGILVMDRTEQIQDIDPETLAVNYNDPSRFLSIDEVTDRLVSKDPGLLLIDVRPAEQFKMFAIPNAINIPLDSLLANSTLELMRMTEMDKVLYSNSGVSSDQAWLLMERMNMPSVFVMEGGLNNWFKSIVQASAPPSTASREDFDLYSFRLAANQYFYGSAQKPTSAEIKVAKKTQVIRKAPEPETGGGC